MEPALLIAVAVGATVFFTIYGMTAPTVAPRDREWTDPQHRPGLISDGWTPPTTTHTETPSTAHKVFMSLTRSLLPKTPALSQITDNKRKVITELLNESGNPWNITPEEYQGLRAVSAMAGAATIIALTIAGIFPLPLYAAAAAGAGIGFLLPKYLLKKHREQRIREARSGLPDAIDLLLVTMNRDNIPVTRAIAETAPRLPEGVIRDEFLRMAHDLGSGRTVASALTSFRERVPTTEADNFTRAVTQADKLGARISETLRLQSDAIRRDYHAHLSKSIASLSGRMYTFLVVLGVPALLLTIVAPPLYEITQTLG